LALAAGADAGVDAAAGAEAAVAASAAKENKLNASTVINRVIIILS